MLPARPISALDAVNPAIEWTKRAVFRPFQWAKWWRFGLMALLAGELQSVGCNLGDVARLGDLGDKRGGAGGGLPGIDKAVLVSIIGVLVIGVIILALVHLYLMSVARFVMFDTVATGRYRIREGWSRWNSRGWRWFGFMLVFMLISGGAVMLVLLPFIGAIAAIKKTGPGAAIGAILLAIPILLVLGIVIILLYVLAKDFAVPLVALEDEGAFAAFRRVVAMARARMGEFAGYIGIKIALSIGYSMVFLIATLIVFIPAVVVFVAILVAVGVSSPDALKNPVLLALGITVFVVAIFVIGVLLAMVFAPAIFFFQAYTYTWFAQRYEPLWRLLYPEQPQTVTTTPSEPPPLTMA